MKIYLMILVVLAVLNSAFAQFSAQVITTANDLGGGRWEYSYDITNTGTESIEELTIWFDYSGYTNFAITTADAGSWSEVIIAPDDLTLSGAGYDILNITSPLGASQSFDGFSVAFDYSGEDPIPSLVQMFEIIDSSNFETFYEGQTVPEPATLVLLAIGGLTAFRKSPKNAI